MRAVLTLGLPSVALGLGRARRWRHALRDRAGSEAGRGNLLKALALGMVYLRSCETLNPGFQYFRVSVVQPFHSRGDKAHSQKFGAMENRPPFMLIVGAFGGAVSAAAYRLAPIDDLLPLNQALFAGLCGLMVVWFVLWVR